MDNDPPRDCTHPLFPLRRQDRDGGNNSPIWLAQLHNRTIRYCTTREDPTGAYSWKLFEHERTARERGENPRAENRSLLARAWLLSAPLNNAGIAILDPSILRVVCVRCAAVWRIRFNPKSWEIPPKLLACPYGCMSGASAEEIRDLILRSILPEEIPVETYRLFVRARRAGWTASPLAIELAAENEGVAIQRLMTEFSIKRPRCRRAATINRHSLIRSGTKSSTTQVRESETASYSFLTAGRIQEANA